MRMLWTVGRERACTENRGAQMHKMMWSSQLLSSRGPRRMSKVGGRVQGVLIAFDPPTRSLIQQ